MGSNGKEITVSFSRLIFIRLLIHIYGVLGLGNGIYGSLFKNLESSMEYDKEVHFHPFSLIR